MLIRVLGALAGLALLGACAYTPHQVAVTAAAPRVASKAGEGVTLALEVIDDRDSTVVGQRGIMMEGADITAPGVTEALERELKAGFEAQGFRVVRRGSPADADVEARLRAFKFFLETGILTGAENVDVVVAVEAKTGGTEFDRTYRASSETAAIVVPGGKAIDQKLNAGLASVLSQIMSDKQLIGFLSRPPAAGT
jgi:uncharacterized lipoprotein YajG